MHNKLVRCFANGAYTTIAQDNAILNPRPFPRLKPGKPFVLPFLLVVCTGLRTKAGIAVAKATWVNEEFLSATFASNGFIKRVQPLVFPTARKTTKDLPLAVPHSRSERTSAVLALNFAYALVVIETFLRAKTPGGFLVWLDLKRFVTHHAGRVNWGLSFRHFPFPLYGPCDDWDRAARDSARSKWFMRPFLSHLNYTTGGII